MRRTLALLFVCSLALTACDKKAAKKPTSTTNSAKKTAPKPKKPKKKQVHITFGFPPRSNVVTFMPKAKKFTKLIADETGWKVDVFIPKSYTDAISAFKHNKVQAAYFEAWPFLKAHLDADASLLLAAEIDGKPNFKSEWLVLKSSKIKKLSDLKHHRVAFAAPTSAAGFLFPYARLVKDGVIKKGADLRKTFKSIAFSGSDEHAVEELLNKKIDATAISDLAFAKLPKDQQAKLRVLATEEGVPTPTIAVRAEMPMDDKDKLRAALLKLDTPANQPLFQEVLDAKVWIKRSHGDHMTPLQEAQDLIQTEYPTLRDE